MKNNIKKHISFIMCLIMVLSSLHVIAYANYDSNKENIDVIMNADYDDYKTEIEIKKQYFSEFEITSLREENSKQFALENGKYRMDVYPYPIHIKDENCRWIDMDNTQRETQTRDGNSSQLIYQDTYIDGTAANSNFSTATSLKVGLGAITYMDFSLPNTLPEETTIDSAFLNVYYFYDPLYTSGYMNLSVYRVETQLNFSTLTWNIADNNDFYIDDTTAYGTKNLYASSNPSHIYTSFSITDLAIDWSNGTSENGIAITRNSGTLEELFIDSYEYSNNNTPIFTMTYNLDYYPIENGTYFIRNSYQGKSLNVNSTSDQTPVVINTHGESSNIHQWTLTYLHNGYYKISLGDSGLQNNDAVLAVKINNENSTNGEIVIESTFNRNYRQQWDISYITSTGYYMLRARSSETSIYSNLYLDATTTGYVYQNTTNSSSNCDWYFLSMLPTSGYELEYDASKWTIDSEQEVFNCYSYALNNQLDKFGTLLTHYQQPGEFANITHNVNASWTATEIDSNIKADFNAFFGANGNQLITEIAKNSPAQTGRYKIALYFTPEDYHFYVQNADGYWSHKDGSSPVSREDDYGNLIIDPDYAFYLGGKTLVNFYEIVPWNNLYNSGN